MGIEAKAEFIDEAEGDKGACCCCSTGRYLGGVFGEEVALMSVSVGGGGGKSFLRVAVASVVVVVVIVTGEVTTRTLP